MNNIGSLSSFLIDLPDDSHLSKLSETLQNRPKPNLLRPTRQPRRLFTTKTPCRNQPSRRQTRQNSAPIKQPVPDSLP